MRYPVLASLVVLLFCVPKLFAQEYEIHPYAGGFFPGKFLGLINVKNEGLYGVKGGWFLTRNFEAEGNVGYINNLSLEDSFTRQRAYIWEGLASYNLGRKPTLYGTLGAGALTTSVRSDSREFFSSDIVTRDTFLAVSYGGGIKVLRAWGPAGYRAEVKGRTMPHYYGFRFNWVEATAGLTFSWGER